MRSMGTPLITVYITNHNYGNFIEKAIRSVLEQTIDDFELIIIDDGSTDNSREIISQFVSKNINNKIIPIFQQNKGLNVTNNIASRVARGRYILRLDADDWLDPHALEVMSNTLERNPNYGLVFPDYYLVDSLGRILQQVRRHDFSRVELFDQPAHGACTMIRRRCLQEIGGYDESFRCQDGFDLWMRFIQRFEVINVNLPLFYYRKHGSNLTSSEDLILSTRTQIIKGQFERRCTPINVLAVIPIRGPVADSNSPVFRKIGDRPLIDWTVDAALRAKRLTKVAVTSPDPDVLRFVRSTWPAQVLAIERDHTMALINTSLNDTILHTIDMVERQDSSEANCHFDAVMQLAIESPFRTGQNIDSAIEVMELFDADAVVGVRPESDIFYRHNGGGLVPIRENVGLRLEREDIYRDAGSMRLCKRSSMIRYEPMRFIRVGHVVLNSKEALAVRNDWDFDLADYIANWKPNSIQD